MSFGAIGVEIMAKIKIMRVVIGFTKKEKRKRLVRYKEGAEMYSMGMNKFQALAKDARAVLKIDRMVLVDLDIFDEYLETFRV